MAHANEDRSEADTNSIIAEQNDRFRTTWGLTLVFPVRSY